jgi:D-serine dehydratase
MTETRRQPKGFPFETAAATGWGIFDQDVAYPTVVMFASALEHNCASMRAYCDRHGVSLAPHGKTTMSPSLFRRQLDHGAWAITAATAWQARMMWESGVDRVLIANQVVTPGEIAWLVRAGQRGLTTCCYVDSVDGVELLDAALAASGRIEPYPVLLEVGVRGGRTGTRDLATALEVARAAARAPHLALTGTSGFEGLLPAGDRVDEFLDRMVDVTHAVAAEGLFDPQPELIVTAGGSAYFDHVVAKLTQIDTGLPTRVVIRSGCYITHDDGSLHEASPMGAEPRTGHDDHLLAALEVWGVVLSRPEPTRAIVGVGKRDASTDGLLPLMKKVRRRGSQHVEAVTPRRVVQVNDQHSFLDLEPDDRLAVGDLVGFGISHPCTTFDKWRSIPIVDDDYGVIEVAETHF